MRIGRSTLFGEAVVFVLFVADSAPQTATLAWSLDLSQGDQTHSLNHT